MKTNIFKNQFFLYGIFCFLLFLLPLLVDDPFYLNKSSTYICFGLLAVSLSLSWGYTGILNLGNAVFFGLGSYCMAMSLKLKTDAVHTGSGGLPDFMVWNNVTELPWFWEPFYSLSFGIFAGIAVPVILAIILGYFIFGGRASGVYVAIITLAAMIVVYLLIMDQQAYTGGFNGITDLSTLKFGKFEFDAYGASAYNLIVSVMTLVLFLTLIITKSRAGLIFQAIRDDENRVRFLGYNVGVYKTASLCISAGIGGVAGMLYTIVMEFASPTFLSVPLSLSVVIWCAVGGRQSIFGSFIGALIITSGQGFLSESETFLHTWTLIMGLIFILSVLFLPKGLAGIFSVKKK